MGYSHKNRVVPRKFMLPSLFCGREFFCFLTSSEQKAYVFQKQKTKFFIIKVCFLRTLFPFSREMSFFLFERKKNEKRSKKPAVLSLIDFETSLSRSPIGYHPPQRTRLKVCFRPRSRNLRWRNWFISDVLALSEKSACRTALKRRQA